MAKGITLDADRLEVTSCGGLKTGGHVDWYSFMGCNAAEPSFGRLITTEEWMVVCKIQVAVRDHQIWKVFEQDHPPVVLN